MKFTLVRSDYIFNIVPFFPESKCMEEGSYIASAMQNFSTQPGLQNWSSKVPFFRESRVMYLHKDICHIVHPLTEQYSTYLSLI